MSNTTANQDGTPGPSRLLSDAIAEGRHVGWPGPRGQAYPADEHGALIDDRCMQHEHLPAGSTCPLCRGAGRKNPSPTEAEVKAWNALVSYTKTKCRLDADRYRARSACRALGIELDLS